MEKKKILMKSKVAAPNLLRTLHSLYQFGHLCDVTVHTQHLGIQEEFLVHKAVLAASSNYFRGLFLHDEMLETKNCTVTLPDIYTEEFTSFLEFVYTAEVEIEAEKLQRMKEIAERLECKDLLDICEEVKAEGRKGLDLSLHLKSQLCDDGDAPWPRVPPEEARRRSGSSQVAVMPVQRKLWEKRKREKDRLLAGYQLGEGEKKRDPQACPYCDKVVGSKCGLTVHIRSHTGERPYRCERCPATFAQRSAYNAHLRKIHQSGRERELLPVYWMVVRPNVTSCNEDPAGDPRGGTSEPEQWTRERHQEEEPSPAPEANCGNEEEEWKEKEGGRGEGDGDEGERSVKGEEEVGSEVEERRDSEEVCTEEDGGYSHEEDGEEHALNEKLKTKKINKNGMSKKATYVISCEKCKEQFVSRKKYVDHCRDVHQCPPGKAYRCDICGKSFASYNSWKEHRACVHSEERRFACTLCTATFKRKRDVRSHAVRKHEGRVKRPLCSVCGKILSSRTALVFHMRTHTGEKPHQCGLCHARFAQPSQLKIHTRSHTGEKPYICEDCGASFADRGKLTAHKRTHTGERLFKCDVCAKHFATKEYLKCHKRCHMGAKPYKCQVCGKTFGLRASLAQHSNVHAETRPYFCEQCGKTFTQQGALRRHQRIHTGEKPYKCRACERTFTDMSTLRRHASIHDRNAHWRSFLIDLTTKKDHNWSKIEPFSEAGAGEEDSVPETWSVDRGKLSNPQSGALKQVEPVPSSVGNVEDTESSILFL